MSNSTRYDINITKSVRLISLFRGFEFMIFIILGYASVVAPLEYVFVLVSNKELDVDEIVFNILMMICCVPLLVLVWRNKGTVNYKTLRIYERICFILSICVLALLIIINIGLHIVGNIDEGAFNDELWFINYLIFIYFCTIILVAYIALYYLRVLNVSYYRLTIDQIVADVEQDSDSKLYAFSNAKSVNAKYGYIFALMALIVIIVGNIVVPNVLSSNYNYNNLTRLSDTIAAILLVYARRYFQLNPDSLLSIDHRAKILFLRAFIDDKIKNRFNLFQPYKIVFDYSLESRLAAHFYKFGPFFAIGSPSDTVPQIGASRIILNDDEWQKKVLIWIKEASVILMMYNNKKWVNWELNQIIDQGKLNKLIIVFPELNYVRWYKEKYVIEQFVENLREIFKHTIWYEELNRLTNYSTIKAIVFNDDGSLVSVSCRSKSRDAYYLSTVVAHYFMLHSDKLQDSSTLPVTKSKYHFFHKYKYALFIQSIMSVMLITSLLLTGYTMSRLQNKYVQVSNTIIFKNLNVDQQTVDVVKAIIDQKSDLTLYISKVGVDYRNKEIQLHFVPINPKDDKYISIVNILKTDIGLLGYKIQEKLNKDLKVQLFLSNNNFQDSTPIRQANVIQQDNVKLYYTIYSQNDVDIANQVFKLMYKYGLFAQPYERIASIEYDEAKSKYVLGIQYDTEYESSTNVEKKYNDIIQNMSLYDLGGALGEYHFIDQHLNRIDDESIVSLSLKNAELHANNNQPELAILACKIALEYDKNQYQKLNILHNIANIQLNSKQLDQCIQTYLLIESLDSNNLDTKVTLGELYLKLDQTGLAINKYKDIEAKNSQSNQALILKSMIMEKLSVQGTRKKNIPKNTNIPPELLVVDDGKSKYYQTSETDQQQSNQRNNQTSETGQQQSNQRNNPSQSDLKVYRNNGERYLNNKLYGSAISELNKIPDNMRNSDIYYLLASSYMGLKMYQEAYNSYSKCIDGNYAAIAASGAKNAKKKIKNK